MNSSSGIYPLNHSHLRSLAGRAGKKTELGAEKKQGRHYEWQGRSGDIFSGTQEEKARKVRQHKWGPFLPRKMRRSRDVYQRGSLQGICVTLSWTEQRLNDLCRRQGVEILPRSQPSQWPRCVEPVRAGRQESTTPRCKIRKALSVWRSGRKSTFLLLGKLSI